MQSIKLQTENKLKIINNEAFIGLLLTIGIPLVMLIYNGIKLIIGWNGGKRP